jgi:hypothetical protein
LIPAGTVFYQLKRKELGMKISNSAARWKIVAGVIAILFLVNIGALFAEEASTVQVLKSPGDKPELVLSAPDLYIAKNGVVIWLNSVKNEEIQVVFKDGKVAMDVSFSPAFKSFCLDSSSCFVTSFIPYAATSSLQFTKAGTFDYSVSNRTGKSSVKGKIIVRDM